MPLAGQFLLYFLFTVLISDAIFFASADLPFVNSLDQHWARYKANFAVKTTIYLITIRLLRTSSPST